MSNTFLNDLRGVLGEESYAELIIGDMKICIFWMMMWLLTHWGLVTPYGDIDLGQHRLR